jgi:hypothetical protein
LQQKKDRMDHLESNIRGKGPADSSEEVRQKHEEDLRAEAQRK